MEQLLNRRQRCTLSQLRSGHCHLLQDYKHRVLGEPSDVCTDCGASPQDVRHLFACTTHPTNLSPEDLWRIWWNLFVRLANMTTEALTDLTTDLTTDLVVENNNNNQTVLPLLTNNKKRRPTCSSHLICQHSNRQHDE